MDEVSLNSEPVYDDEAEEFEIDGDCAMTEYVGEAGVLQGENPLPPAVGMEFETYEDVYYFYNCYAKQQGFGVRVSNTWYRKSRERYRGKLSCSSAGFKKKSEANRPRPETRTGCPAMIKFRLMENRRWRVIEVELEHNHLLCQTSGKFYKSHRNIGPGSKRPLQIDGPEEVQKIRLFRTVIIDTEDSGNVNIDEGEFGNNVEQFNNQLKLKKGDAQSLHKFFSHPQLINPNFFYVMDLNEKGCLRNVFWADARSRATYGYFGDVVLIDNSCLTSQYEVPLIIFTGVNHHGQSVPLGCGLIAGETVESYIWLFRAWLTYVIGRPPQAIITDVDKSLQTALSEVFPRSAHFLSLTCILEKVQDELGELSEYQAIMAALTRSVYHSVRAVEFEAAWEDMVERHGIRYHKWLQLLYEDRKRWVPVYLKETFLAGIFPMKESERLSSPFEGYLSNNTSLEEFLGNYDQALNEINQRELLADMESRNPCGMSKSTFYFELQVSKLYTNNIFMKFQEEVVGMYACFNTRQTSMDGSVLNYLVKEHAEIEDNRRETREYEVTYNTSDAEILCACGLFSFKGYLCRHALCVLNQNGLEEIPPQYILSRWRKDIHRSYAFDYGCNGIDINNPLHRYDNLYKCITKVVEEGKKSRDRYKFTLQALEEILNKVRLEEDHQLV
ncbi:hypothetical protein ACH5RR_024629 [Cinchona calisaya]|uniref:Protein FAR1-RELATED SEQUENCE n=1 Tax=Cinchona calisaya TaxID=153742 RepID=A0ABD2Z0F9_9GENT